MVPVVWSRDNFTDTDFVVSVQAINDRIDIFVARGTFCTIDRYITDRPLSGVIVLNLAAILLDDGTPNNNPSFIKTQQRTVLHELTHAMVFHPFLYQYYADQWGNFRSFNWRGTQEIWRSSPLDEE